MSISLVSIQHPTDPSIHIPFIGSRGPIKRIPLEDFKIKSIIDQGFLVEIHQKPYDPLFIQNQLAIELQSQLDNQTVEKKEELSQSPIINPIPVVIPPTINEPVVVPEVLDESSLDPKKEEESVISEEELIELKKRIELLKSLEEAKTLIAEYQIELDGPITKLKDVKLQLLELINIE
jgi:hypothetical protein